MQLVAPTDAVFLAIESRDQPMHVGGLQLYRRPEGAGRNFLRDTYETLVRSDDIAPLFRRRPNRSLATLGQWTWVDEDVDLEHHMRHSALPRPGRVRELLALTSRLHSTLLDRHRPMWEAHLIEGLSDNRFAVYTKLHHSLMDGVSALRLLRRSLSERPDEPTPPPGAPRATTRRGSNGSGPGGLVRLPVEAVRAAAELAGTVPAMLRLAGEALTEQTTVLPMQAPRSMLNVSITGSRRYAAQSWPLPRIRAVARASGVTVNDVVLAMCAGALRRYLIEHNALPDAPLVAMTPVSLRAAGDDAESGNAVGAILVSLATDEADPGRRLALIHEGTDRAKAHLRQLSPLQVLALSALAMAPIGLSMFLPLYAFAPPPFNLVISNVPGPTQPLYWNGAQLLGSYPLSIPTHGQALNITVTSYNDSLDFGLTGCRRSVPSLQRLLTHLDDELAQLATAVAA